VSKLLTAVEVELLPSENGALPFSNALYLHQFFLSLIKEEDPFLSETLQDKAGFKPYTLSMLKGGKNINGEITILKEGNFRFRVTFMNDHLFHAFYNAIYSKQNQAQQFSIGKLNFQVGKIKLEKSEDFYDLLNNKGFVSNQFELTFLSPTSFRVQGRNYLFPDPLYLIRSYFEKWNMFCPENLKNDNSDLDFFVSNCFPVKHHLYTELLDMGSYKVIGFRGKCLYELGKNKLDDERLHKLKALLLYSKYCGTGYKTTMGMGQTNVNFIKKD